MINNKILGLIGLAARARNICFGSDSVEENIVKHKVDLIILAEDGSERTKSKFIKLSQDYNVPILVQGDIETLSKTIGKLNKAVIGIKDKNIAKGIQEKQIGGGVIG